MAPDRRLEWPTLEASAAVVVKRIQEKQGKNAEARQSYTNALKLAPDPKVLTEGLKRMS